MPLWPSASFDASCLDPFFSLAAPVSSIHLRTIRTDAQAIASTHSPINAHRTISADPNDNPTPVSISTYAATHPGHFGMSASPAIGIAHRAAAPPRRVHTRTALGEGSGV